MLNKYSIVKIARNTFILHNQRLPLTRLPDVELQTKNQLEISCRNFEIISRNFELLSRNFALLSRNVDILCRNFEIVNRNFEITINRNKSVCGPNAPSYYIH